MTTDVQNDVLTSFRYLGEDPASKLKIVHNLKIDPQAIIPCPRFNFEATAAADFCPECPNYEGLAQMAPIEKDRTFDKTFAIRCAYPIERRTVMIKVNQK